MTRFPRDDDGKGWAWGLQGSAPTEIWERLSPAYEAQALTVMAEVIRLYGRTRLDWAGSEDGEAVLALAPSGELVGCWHLENPEEARAIALAIGQGRLASYLRDDG